MKLSKGYRDLCVLFFLALTWDVAKSNNHGWQEWGQFSTCSRTCGGGVMQRSRTCAHNQGAGRHHCQGPETEYKSCNTQPCPRRSLSYREVQCAEFDNEPQFVQGRYQRYQWVPHTDTASPCALTCRAVGTDTARQLRPVVRDGTECDTHDSYGVCVAGTCREVGCDREFDSQVKEDRCRVCGGDGSACKTTSGVFNPLSLNVGFNDVITIPEGATTITVKEAAPSRNFIALRGSDGRFLLNGGSYQQRSHQFDAVGTVFSYHQPPNDASAPEELTAKGPINETLHVLMRNEGGRVDVQYEYSMPQRLVDKATPNARFTWVHGLWTRCSKDCGTGYQLRQVSCVDRETGSMVTESKCEQRQRPITNQTCNDQPCADSHTNGYLWVPGHWDECEALCGDGEQTQLMYCQHNEPSGQAAYVSDDLCTRHVGPKPQYKRACVAKDGCPYWATSAWSECTVTCGHGVEQRRVYCQQDPKNANDIPRILPDSRCQDLDKPQAQRQCRLAACLDGSNSQLHEFQGTGTEVKTTDCSKTKHGCCSDGVTPASGPNGQGCSSRDRCSQKDERGDGFDYTVKWFYDSDKARCDRFWYGGRGGNDNRFDTQEECEEACIKSTDSDELVSIECGTSQWGCCPDGQTPATGPGMQGCRDILVADNGRCQNTIYRCCPDGRTPAKGPNNEGCDEGHDHHFDAMSCGEPKESGPCRNFSIQWHFDTKLGSCRQFWYGGCEGNKNRFQDRATCEKFCLTVHGDDICRLPPVTGRCRAAHPRWYYDPRARACQQFTYGGCNGNANRFRTRTECERRCGETTLDQTAVQVKVVTPKPIHTGPLCARTQYGCCLDGVSTATGPNYAGCSCESSTYGCCDDGVTAAQGPDQEGCEVGSGDTCEESEHGCCPDGFSFATGPRHQGCPGVDHRVDHTLRPDTGRDREEDRKDLCTHAQDRGPCTDYTIRWYYNHVNKECDRFWYGGCEGNKNNFLDEAECKKACVAPPPTATPPTGNVCEMPAVVGPCKARLTRWYYDPRYGSCRTFSYGGCMGNGNNFLSRDQCEVECIRVLTPSPTAATTTTAAPTTESLATTVTVSLTGPEAVRRGEMVTLTCQVRLPRTVPEDIMWYHNNAVASTGPGVTITKAINIGDRSMTSEFIIRRASSEDAGIYHCRALPSGELRSMNLAVREDDNNNNNNVNLGSDDPAEVCMMPAETGNCFPSLRRWNYDHKTGQCQQFMYGGCDGNKNNFNTKAECEKFCSKAEVCKLSADPGNCRAYFKKYHFDANTGQCKEFVYGGCGGNPNNFDSMEACQGKCQADEPPRTGVDEGVCLMPRDGGNCGGYEIVWYYDTKYQRCGRFIYTGCQGNGNRFPNEQACMATCEGVTEGGREITTTTPAPTTPRYVQPVTLPPVVADPCQQSKDRGPCSNYTILWYYDKEGGYCNRFYYGGCRGNGNRFPSREACEDQCIRRERPVVTTIPTTIPATTTAPRNPFDCRYSRYGCCDDGVTSAMDEARSNCVTDNEPDVVWLNNTQGAMMLVRPGKEVFLTCELRRDRYDAVSWYKDGFLVSSGRDYSVLTNGTLLIRRMTPLKSGYYACQVQSGNAIPAIQRFRVQTRVPLSIVPGPNSASVRPGENVFLHCQAYGNPEPRIVWQREGRALNDPRYRAFPNGTLIIQQARDQDQGEFQCVAVNDISTSNPRKIQLSVRERVKARIQAHKGKVMEGDSIQLQCKVTGYPQPTSAWLKDGKVLEPGDRVRIYGEKLVVYRAAIDDSGIYTCRADNGEEQAKDTTTVQVAIADSSESCTDTLSEKQCMLIVTGRLCGHRMYSRMCCISCTEDSSRFG